MQSVVLVSVYHTEIVFVLFGFIPTVLKVLGKFIVHQWLRRSSLIRLHLKTSPLT